MPCRLLLPGTAREMLSELIDGMVRSRLVRVVNFHATPRYREAEFRRQVEAYAERFEPITRANLPAAVDGSWPYPRPGLIPVLFEGYRDNLDVLLPILEEHGFTAWFFLPSAFMSVPAAEQRAYAAAHVLHLPARDEYPDDRIAITWDEARGIRDRGHVFACHSRTHAELLPDTPLSVIEDEIVGAKAEMEAELGCEVDTFCWLRGAEIGINPAADRLLLRSGFRYLFSKYKIQKLQ